MKDKVNGNSSLRDGSSCDDVLRCDSQDAEGFCWSNFRLSNFQSEPGSVFSESQRIYHYFVITYQSVKPVINIISSFTCLSWVFFQSYKALSNTSYTHPFTHTRSPFRFYFHFHFQPYLFPKGNMSWSKTCKIKQKTWTRQSTGRPCQVRLTWSG